MQYAYIEGANKAQAKLSVSQGRQPAKIYHLNSNTRAWREVNHTINFQHLA
jgi:hypothetical protein